VTTEILEALFLLFAFLVVAYLVRHYIFTLTVIRLAERKTSSADGGLCPYEPTVSILIPAHNEEQVLERTLQRMTELDYPRDKLQIVVINDASTDRTGEIAERFSNVYSHVKVMHRGEHEGGRGKAAALNAAMKLVEKEIVVCFDADYYPQSDAVAKLARAFADPRVGAVQGRVIVLNEPCTVVTRLVALERIGGYCVDQQARDSLGLIPQFGGTVGAVRRSLLDSLGGWDESVLAEDTELTFRVCLAGYRVRYDNDAECYEEAVEDWQAYWRQRYRWAKGHMQVAFKHGLKVARSDKLSRREKVDGLLLLNVYFMPVLVPLSWAIGVALFLSGFSQWFSMVWAVLPICLYSCVGNFAPFFEVGIGAYLDGRGRASWLMPLLAFTFVYNILICTKALIDLAVGRILGKHKSSWGKTVHSGMVNVRKGQV